MFSKLLHLTPVNTSNVPVRSFCILVLFICSSITFYCQYKHNLHIPDFKIIRRSYSEFTMSLVDIWAKQKTVLFTANTLITSLETRRVDVVNSRLFILPHSTIPTHRSNLPSLEFGCTFRSDTDVDNRRKMVNLQHLVII